MFRLYGNQTGAGLIIVIAILLIVGTIGAVFVSLINTETFTAMGQAAGKRAGGIAEAGVEKALYEYKNGTVCASLGFAGSIGSGSFTTIGTVYNPASTILSAAISNVVQTIPVASVAGYAPHGRITIESEEIDYFATSTVAADCVPFGQPCFTGSKRGANGTTAAAHGAAVSVSQDECLISSTGTVGGPLGTSQRVIEVAAASQGAQLRGVQTGSATSTANGTLSVPIPTAVDPTKAFLIFNTRHNSNRPVGSMVRGRILNGTTMEFLRVTDEAVPVPIVIRWYVVEYVSGVNVQRGEVIQNVATMNIPIADVGTIGQAFVTWSKTAAATDGDYGQDDPVLGELTTSTNLQFRVNSANASHRIWWQVIAFTNPNAVNVQKGSTSLTGGSTSVTVVIPTAVDPTKTFLLVSYRTNGSGADVGRRMLRAQLTSPTTIVIDRSIAAGSDPISEIVWQAVELKGSSTVQHATQNFPAGISQIQVNLTGPGNVQAINVGAISINGALAGAPEAFATNTNFGSATITTGIVTLTANAWLIDVVGSGNAGNFTPGGGQTERWDTSVGTATGASSTKPMAVAGATSMTQTHSTTSNRNAHAVISIAPDPLDSGITFDAQSSSQATNVSSISWPHVIGNGSNRKLIVGVAIEENTPGNEVVTGVTYNGTPLTFAAAITATSGFLQHVEIWYLDNPMTNPSTTQVVPITPVDTTRSIAFSAVQPVGGQNMGRSPYTGDDIIGVGSYTMDLSSTQLTIERSSDADTSDVGWFVVEFNSGGGGAVIGWRDVY